MSDSKEFELVFEGPKDDSPETLTRIKGVMIGDCEMSISDVKEALENAPLTIFRSDNEKELKVHFSNIQAAGGKVLLVRPKEEEQTVPEPPEAQPTVQSPKDIPELDLADESGDVDEIALDFSLDTPAKGESDTPKQETPEPATESNDEGGLEFALDPIEEKPKADKPEVSGPEELAFELEPVDEVPSASVKEKATPVESVEEDAGGLSFDLETSDSTEPPVAEMAVPETAISEEPLEDSGLSFSTEDTTEGTAEHSTEYSTELSFGDENPKESKPDAAPSSEGLSFDTGDTDNVEATIEAAPSEVPEPTPEAPVELGLSLDIEEEAAQPEVLATPEEPTASEDTPADSGLGFDLTLAEEAPEDNTITDLVVEEYEDEEIDTTSLSMNREEFAESLDDSPSETSKQEPTEEAEVSSATSSVTETPVTEEKATEPKSPAEAKPTAKEEPATSGPAKSALSVEEPAPKPTAEATGTPLATEDVEETSLGEEFNDAEAAELEEFEEEYQASKSKKKGLPLENIAMVVLLAGVLFAGNYYYWEIYSKGSEVDQFALTEPPLPAASNKANKEAKKGSKKAAQGKDTASKGAETKAPAATEDTVVDAAQWNHSSEFEKYIVNYQADLFGQKVLKLSVEYAGLTPPEVSVEDLAAGKELSGWVRRLQARELTIVKDGSENGEFEAQGLARAYLEQGSERGRMVLKVTIKGKFYENPRRIEARIFGSKNTTENIEEFEGMYVNGLRDSKYEVLLNQPFTIQGEPPAETLAE